MSIPAHAPTVPLVDLVDEYLTDCIARGLAAKTLHSYEYGLRSVLLPWCEGAGIMESPDLDQRAMDRLSAHLLTTPGRRKGSQLSRYTVAGYLGAVRHFVDWANRRGEQLGRPHLPKTPRKARQILTREEVQAMEDHARSERDKLIIRLLADRGLRLGEMVRLRTTDVIELQRGRWFLHVRGKGQGGAGLERMVPLPRWWRRLQRYATIGRTQVDSDALFVSLRLSEYGIYEPLGFSGVEQAVRWAARAAGIKRQVTPHLLRHTAITYLGSLGLNSFQISMIVGNFNHADLYMHLTPMDAAEALGRIER